MDEVETRPVWDFATPEKQVRFFMYNYIAKVTSHDELYDCDKERAWFIFHSKNYDGTKGKQLKISKDFSSSTSIVNFLKLDLIGGEAVKIDEYYRIKWYKKIQDMEDFDKKHAKDLKEYERLKDKFSNV